MVSLGSTETQGLRKPKGTVLELPREGILQPAISGSPLCACTLDGDLEGRRAPSCDILVTSTARCSASPQGPPSTRSLSPEINAGWK